MTKQTMQGKVSRVFVDLDRTLLPFDTVMPVWRSILKLGLKPKLSISPYTKGLANYPKALMVSCFRGMREDDFQKLCYDMAKPFVNKIDLSIKNWAEEILPNKSSIHIVTGSLQTLVDGIANHLGWGQCVGTKPEISNGILTGDLEGYAVKGQQKVVEIKKSFSMSDEDFKSCAAVGDSYSDRFLMEKCSTTFFPLKASSRLTRYLSFNRNL